MDIDITPKYIECPSPNTPEYKQLSDKAHIGSIYNLNILTDNLSKSLEYNDRLINTLKCYQMQAQSPSKVVDEDKK